MLLNMRALLGPKRCIWLPVGCAIFLTVLILDEALLSHASLKAAVGCHGTHDPQPARQHLRFARTSLADGPR